MSVICLQILQQYSLKYLCGVIAFKHGPIFPESCADTGVLTSATDITVLVPKCFQQQRELRVHRELFCKLMMCKPEYSGFEAFGPCLEVLSLDTGTKSYTAVLQSAVPTQVRD